ncbi:MAG: bifunctional riboflavin kinase/FAD synthetase [Gammaproteobacteria bacterium]|nr:bifunctional riboflavin kinase/FAD synthetase [Gammaproteobacteria bacterium]
MEIIRGLINVRDKHKGSVVTIGNYDGVHLGHQVILSKVRERAKALGVSSMLICFEPQPREFFDEYNAPARLTRFREKVELLKHFGIDRVLCFKFDQKARTMKAREFIDILVDRLAIRALFVGDDWRFGSDREGDFALLKKAGREFGFEVTDTQSMTYEAIRVSSTRIRECLERGEFKAAEEMLGHPFAITGKVVHGRQLGRELEAPTANIQLHRYRAPIDGVYAVEVDGLDRRYQGVANVGVRPTLNDGLTKPILEVHLFDFKQDIYGKHVTVIFRHKIRDEKKFADLELLKKAIGADMQSAREWFAMIQGGNH